MKNNFHPVHGLAFCRCLPSIGFPSSLEDGGGGAVDPVTDYGAATRTYDGEDAIYTYGAGTVSFTLGAETLVQYEIIAGGGSGGSARYSQTGGGGGAGGLLQGSITLPPGTYTGTVGTGGTGLKNGPGNSGADTTFHTFTAIGGGGGAKGNTGLGGAAKTGGSGGGGGGSWNTVEEVGAAGTPGQGNDGGDSNIISNNSASGGGGGAGGVGGNAIDENTPGVGGIGVSSTIRGYSLTICTGGTGIDNGAEAEAVANGVNPGDGGQGNKRGDSGFPGNFPSGSGADGQLVLRIAA